MKVRIGFGLGLSRPRDAGFGPSDDADRFALMVDELDRLGFDSMWLPERITSERIDPIVGLSIAAGRSARLKLGTSVQVLSGRNPVLLAKEWATLDRLSAGRTLPAFGLGVVDAREQQVFGIDRGDRAGWFDEALPLMRRLWTEDGVSHHGTYFHLDDVTIGPKPVQQPPDVWLGGRAPSELRRVARLGDGWLPSFTTPQLCEDGRVLIEAEADRCGRRIDPEHYGLLLGYAHEAVESPFLSGIVERYGIDPSEVIPIGFAEVRRMLSRFIDVGFSKFVLVPFQEPADWTAELEAAAAAVLDLQTSSRSRGPGDPVPARPAPVSAPVSAPVANEDSNGASGSDVGGDRA
jgi:probable F420-dependent oxidoreductase